MNGSEGEVARSGSFGFNWTSLKRMRCSVVVTGIADLLLRSVSSAAGVRTVRGMFL